jgi:hypothetical protein
MSKEKGKDILYSLTKAGIGAIPIIGAPVSELLQLIVTPPIEKRRSKWMLKIGEKIKKLEENNVNIKELENNEVFIDVVLQTTQQALKTSQNEKIQYYQNAILNSAIGENPDLSEIQIFLNLVSNFTVWHIKILKLFDNPKKWFEEQNKEPPSFLGGGLSDIITYSYPELKERKEFYNLIWRDLKGAGLHNTSELGGMMSSSGLFAMRTTAFGKKFLKFVAENPFDKL